MTLRRRALACVALAAALGGAACDSGSSGTSADVGDEAPAFSTHDLAGAPVRLADYRGKIVVLNFWASWCVPCRKEFPLLAQIDSADDIVVLGVVFKDTTTNARAFMTAHKGTWPGLKDDGRIAKAYRVGPGIPSTIVIGTDGRVVKRVIGELRAVTDIGSG